MNSTTDRFSNRPRWATALVLVASGVLGLLAACSSDGNPKPTQPDIIHTGGGGNGGKGGADDSDAGEENSVGGSRAGAGNHKAGGANGGSGGKAPISNGGESGEGAEGGEAGAAPTSPTCPTTDEGFLNQDSNSQKAPFDNTKRLGPHSTLPPLP